MQCQPLTLFTHKSRFQVSVGVWFVTSLHRTPIAHKTVASLPIAYHTAFMTTSLFNNHTHTRFEREGVELRRDAFSLITVQSIKVQGQYHIVRKD